MSFKNTQLTFLIFYLIFCGNVFPQNIEGVNARLDAMAGSASADDIGWTIRHPASICDWPNQVQGSIILMPLPGIGETFGAIIGIVRFNEFLYAGITHNNRPIMPGGFYEEGLLFGNFQTIPGAEPYLEFPQIPQLNVCLKLNDKIQFGIGGFFESCFYELKYEKKLVYNTQGGGSDTIFYKYEHDDKRLGIVGFNVEARFNLGDWTLYPQVMVGFPKLQGTESYDTLDGAMKYFSINNAAAIDTFSNLKHTYSSPQGLYLRGGSYFYGDIGNTFFITGLIFENWRFQLEKETRVRTATVDVDGSIVSGTDNTVFYDTINSDHNDKWLHFFFGFVPSFSGNLYFSPEYNGGIGWFKGKDPDTPSDTLMLRTYHNFRLGIEKYIEDVWFFDKLALRAGIKCQWNKEWRKIDEFNFETSNSDETFPWSSTFWGDDDKRKEAKVVGGFGITKGRGTFDVSCDFLKWQGISSLTGPTAAMATITVDFSRKKEF